MEKQSSLVDTTGLGSYPPLPKQVATSAGNGPGKSSYANVTVNDLPIQHMVISWESEWHTLLLLTISMDGLDAMLENGLWFICNNPLILRKWHPDENLLKENVSTILVWVKFYGAHVMTFSEDGLSAIATKLGTPLMLDSYTADMCMQSWGRSSYARAMIELRDDVELKDNIMVKGKQENDRIGSKPDKNEKRGEVVAKVNSNSSTPAISSDVAELKDMVRALLLDKKNQSSWAAGGRRGTIQLENAVSTISQEYLLEFTSEYGIPEGLHLELPGPEETIVDFSEGKVEDQIQDEVAYEIPPTGNASATGVALETGLEKEVAAMGPPVNKRRHKSGNNEAEANAPPKALRRDYDTFRHAQSTHRGSGSESRPPMLNKETYVPWSSRLLRSSKGMAPRSSPRMLPPRRLTSSSPWGVPNQEGLPLSLSWLGRQAYNIALAWQVAMGSQLRLRFEQEVRLLKKARSKIARRDQRIQTLLEAEVDMKKSAEAKNAELAKELDSLRTQFSDLQVSNKQLSDQVLNLQAHVMGKEKIKAAFEEFKKYEDDKVEQWCAKMDARLDKLSVDFDEELYPHMLTTIAGRRWVIGHGMRLAVMKCAESSEIRPAFADVVSTGFTKGMSEGLEYSIKHGNVGRDLADVKTYDPKSNNNSFQLKISVYPEVRDPEDLWAVKEEMLLEDAIAANISRPKKKKKCRVVCRTHGIGSAHHTRSDGIHVSTHTVPQGLAILLADAATQIEASNQEEPHPRL
uniref:Uncharacterized protein n=1 Tax=Tanacetum cinerariifolium TaxID=118510 RepID=A0A6L2J3R0_TANCI|nr:hypothetical protein [Tanacetum cinerariifolium]